jgi:hypothetical protein
VIPWRVTGPTNNTLIVAALDISSVASGPQQIGQPVASRELCRIAGGNLSDLGRAQASPNDPPQPQSVISFSPPVPLSSCGRPATPSRPFPLPPSSHPIRVQRFALPHPGMLGPGSVLPIRIPPFRRVCTGHYETWVSPGRSSPAGAQLQPAGFPSLHH